MRTLFADTFFFLSVLDSRDAAHANAVGFLLEGGVRFVTTEWVLAEFGNAYSDARDRADFILMHSMLRAHSRFEIVSADAQSFSKGFELFANRAEKDWSLVDCISFVLMKERGITEALTGDRHFEQAGFRALLA
jgi:uncharacterized protein